MASRGPFRFRRQLRWQRLLRKQRRPRRLLVLVVLLALLVLLLLLPPALLERRAAVHFLVNDRLSVADARVAAPLTYAELAKMPLRASAAVSAGLLRSTSNRASARSRRPHVSQRKRTGPRH